MFKLANDDLTYSSTKYSYQFDVVTVITKSQIF